LKQIALIACDHGFGHTKRCYIYGMELAKRGMQVSLFAREDGLEKFAAIYGRSPNLQLIPFRTHSHPDNNQEQWTNWLKDLPNLEVYPIVVSDNLPEILEVRKDAVLSGSFLWHLDLPNIDGTYKAQCESLLSQYKPLHLAADFFVSDELRSKSQIVLLGLIGELSLEKAKADYQSGALLISGGRNSILKSELSSFVRQLIEAPDKPNYTKVWVDSNILPESYPDWMEAAPFNKEMYQSLSVAIIRPGVGTVTDCLRNQVFMIAVAEDANLEMDTNIQALEATFTGQGVDLKSLNAAKLEEFLAIEYPRFVQNARSISFNGEQQFADTIQNSLLKA
jgi:UDP:flavonoid glycosyltransferase YjiC (YdhE family)